MRALILGTEREGGGKEEEKKKEKEEKEERSKDRKEGRKTFVYPLYIETKLEENRTKFMEKIK